VRGEREREREQIGIAAYRDRGIERVRERERGGEQIGIAA
jgi:hypothetical protein